MFSKKFQLSLFIAALQQHYRARLADMVSPFVTKQIIDFLACLRRDQLVSAFIVYRRPGNTAFWSVRVVFSYTNNHTLLFSHIRTIQPLYYVSATKLQQLVRAKTSLAFPILILDTPTHGFLTDRQMVYLQLHGQLSERVGGRVVARIDNF